MPIRGTITLNHLYNDFKDEEGDVLPENYVYPNSPRYEHNYNT